MLCGFWRTTKLSEQTFSRNTFARLKHFRGIATRYDKLKQNYEYSVALAYLFIWLP